MHTKQSRVSYFFCHGIVFANRCTLKPKKLTTTESSGSLMVNQGELCSNTNTMKTNSSMRVQNRVSVHRNRLGLRMIMIVDFFQSLVQIGSGAFELLCCFHFIAAIFLQAVDNLPICEVF